jgi:preprotein translocase subunit SecY
MFGQLFQTFANCFKIPELRSRIIFTALVLGVCRLIAMTPIPGLDGAALSLFFESQSKSAGGNSVVGLYSLFTGGALEKCAVGSLGIMPYISATIIIQLLTAVIPVLSKLAREEGGRAKIIAYGRYLTVLLCLGQGLVMTLGWEHPDKTFSGFTGTLIPADANIWWYRAQTVVVLTTGTLLLMWLGEQITERGVGNGVSLIITIGILARLPLALKSLQVMFFPPEGVEQAARWPTAFLLVACLGVVVAGVIAITQAQRKIPVQYARRAVGRKVFSGGTSFMPLRVNYAGVMPVIFAQAILMFPSMIFTKLGDLYKISFLTALGVSLSEHGWLYLFLFALMILFFSYFWVATQFNELQVSDDLKKHGGYIPGVRPGNQTSDFLHRTMSRITLAGAIFLVIIATIPTLMSKYLGIDYTVAQFFGGTSMLITVGVLLDTMRQMESYLLMRHYDGFLKKGRVKGRVG